MSSDHLNHPSPKSRPVFQVVHTDQGKMYRVTYAGMVKEHYQEWQAVCFYEQAMDMWRMRNCLKPGSQKAMDW